MPCDQLAFHPGCITTLFSGEALDTVQGDTLSGKNECTKSSGCEMIHDNFKDLTIRANKFVRSCILIPDGHLMSHRVTKKKKKTHKKIVPWRKF